MLLIATRAPKTPLALGGQHPMGGFVQPSSTLRRTSCAQVSQILQWPLFGWLAANQFANVCSKLWSGYHPSKKKTFQHFFTQDGLSHISFLTIIHSSGLATVGLVLIREVSHGGQETNLIENWLGAKQTRALENRGDLGSFCHMVIVIWSYVILSYGNCW